MPLFTCKCGQEMTIPETAIGRKGSCASCGKRIKITKNVLESDEKAKVREQARLVKESVKAQKKLKRKIRREKWQAYKARKKKEKEEGKLNQETESQQERKEPFESDVLVRFEKRQREGEEKVRREQIQKLPIWISIAKYYVGFWYGAIALGFLVGGLYGFVFLVIGSVAFLILGGVVTLILGSFWLIMAQDSSDPVREFFSPIAFVLQPLMLCTALLWMPEVLESIEKILSGNDPQNGPVSGYILVGVLVLLPIGIVVVICLQ